MAAEQPSPETERGSDDDGHASDGRFVWPPRPPVGDPLGRHRAERMMSARPRTAAQSSIDMLNPRLDHEARLVASRSAWTQIEETWLGLEAARLSSRVRETGWAADPAESSCGRCGRWVGPFDADGSGCSRCRGKNRPWQAMVRLGGYVPPLSAWVREVKFRRQRLLGFDLGWMLGERLAERIATTQPRPKRVYIVPVPTSAWNRMKRGIDHPLHIARGAAAVLGATVCCALWRRHGWSQTALPASERAANAVRGIRLRWGPHATARTGAWTSRLVPGACVWHARSEDLVIVLDDIMTTGATLDAACKRISRGFRRLGRVDLPRIWAAAVAVTPSPAERGRMEGGPGMFGE